MKSVDEEGCAAWFRSPEELKGGQTSPPWTEQI